MALLRQQHYKIGVDGLCDDLVCEGMGIPLPWWRCFIVDDNLVIRRIG
jgi:hypothetical protein